MPPLSSTTEIIVILLLAVAEFFFCALPAVLWVVIGKQAWREAFAWRRPMGREMLGASLVGMGLLLCVPPILVLQNHLWPGLLANQQASSAVMLPLLEHHPWLFTITLAGSAAIAEETFFRGPLQRALIKRLPVPVAIGLASILFAAAHFDWVGFLVRAILGVLLAVVVLRGQTIFPAIAMHFVYDLAALGGSAWDVHYLGLSATLRLAGQANMGMSRVQLIGEPLAGILLLTLGGRFCVSAWRLKQTREEEARPPLPTVTPGVWPPPPSMPP